MRTRNNLKSLFSLAKARLLGERLPLAVRWQLTNRCVLKCSYCNIWSNHSNELALNQILSILDQLTVLGTQTISFSGGEPMLREDISEILKETKLRNISTEMNSTGALIPKNIGKLKNLDFLKISLDGPEEVQDTVRGKGSYKIAIEAAKAAKSNNLKFIFSTTLTRHNIEHVEFLLQLAKEYGTLVAFQPLKSLYRGVDDISQLSPDQDKFKVAIKKLIEFKKREGNFMRNSLIGLRHIYNWPQYPRLKCWAGKIFCIIETDGTLLPCDRISYNSRLPNCSEIDFKQALSRLPEVHCGGCGFCGVLELNLLMALKIDTIGSIMKIIK